MAKAFTFKLCPGCGLNKELPPNTVCRECKDAIIAYPKLQAYAKAAEHSTTLAFDHRILPFGLRNYPGAEQFFDSFLDILAAVCPPASGGKAVSLRYHEGLDRHCGVIEPPRCFTVASYDADNAIGRFFSLVNRFLASAKAEGQLKGQNFLAQLASGELSMGDLNQKSADANRLLKD